MTTIFVVAVNLVLLAMVAPLLVALLAGLLPRWPAHGRPHHLHRCPECRCTYQGAPGLVRHYHAQHTDEAVVRMPVDGGPYRTASGPGPGTAPRKRRAMAVRA